ncbi:MAG: lysoplasmalogenase [Parvularculaceae bacterium]
MHLSKPPLIFYLSALAYIATLHLTPYPGDFVLKALPALSLAFWVWRSPDSRVRLALIAALLLSALGDILLAFIPRGSDTFVAGLSAFLIAHLLFSMAFLRAPNRQPRPVYLIVFIVLLSATTAGLLVPKLGSMAGPVLVYSAIITLMTIASVRYGQLMAMAGALTFMVSDSLIAFNTFVLADPALSVRYLIMLTYYAALFLITHSLSATKRH